jgi:hypothetical protein
LISLIKDGNMRTFSAILIVLGSALIIANVRRAEPPLAPPKRHYLFHASVIEIQPDESQKKLSELNLSTDEGGQCSFFSGQEIAVPVAGGKAEFIQRGISLKLQAMGTVKKSIHVAGIFEWKEPRLTDKKQLKDGALASQCISEVVHEGETVKVKLDLSKHNGKEYRVEFRVEEIKEEQKSGS